MADITITGASVLSGAGAETETGTLGEAVSAAGKALYKSSDGKWYMADSNAVTEQVRKANGIALNSGGAGQPVKVHKKGPLTIGATLTAGQAYYLSDTPGGICLIADVGSGEYTCLIGLATSTTVIEVDFQYSGVAL